MKRKFQFAASTLLLICVAGSMALPIAAGWDVTEETGTPSGEQWKMLGEQLIGPLCTLPFAAVFLILLLTKKHLPWWLGLPALLGPIYTVKVAGLLSQEFSYLVFQQEEDIYGQIILWLSIVSGVCILTYCLLERTFRPSFEGRA